MWTRMLAALGLLLVLDAGAQLNWQGPAAGHGLPGPPALYGSWGTAAQCAAHRAGIRDDFTLFPYVISEQWIRHGPFYCQVTWQGHRSDGALTRARAYLRCGEDDVRDYRVILTLRDDRLRMRWSEDFTTRPLQSCE